MPKQVTPFFEKGRILKKDALDALRDYPRDMAETAFFENTDGIIRGFGISYQDGMAIVGPGIIKHHGRLVLVREECALSIPCYQKALYCYVNLEAEEKGPDYLVEPYQVLLTDMENPEDGWYELGRFQLEKGAVLRTCGQYKNFPDGDTRVNTCNLIYKKYGGCFGTTLEPKLLQWFGKDLLAMGRLEGLDESFALLCLNGALVERNVILAYLEKKLSRQLKEAGNPELFQGLKEVWNRLSGARGTAGIKGTAGARRTVID